MTNDEAITAITGRLAGLELVVEGLLSAHLGENFPDPVEASDQVRATIMRSSQNAERDIDERSDAAWEEAVKTVDRLFYNVKLRLQKAQGRG